MIRKIKLKAKNQNATGVANISDPPVFQNQNADEIPDTPTCIRCYIKNVSDIQKLNAMFMRFNIGRDNVVIQRVGYMMEGNLMTEIDIAALHVNGYTVYPSEYLTINRHLTSFFKENAIDFKFIDFEDSHKNSADCCLVIDGMSTLCEYITIEKGTVSDELFNYLKERLNLPVSIVSIRIPISDKTGFSITYDTDWKRGNIDTDKNDEKESTIDKNNASDDKLINITVMAYTEDASDSIDVILSQFGSAVGNSMYDYTEKKHDSYIRIIKMDVILNEYGFRLIDSLEWVNNVIVSKN